LGWGVLGAGPTFGGPPAWFFPPLRLVNRCSLKHKILTFPWVPCGLRLGPPKKNNTKPAWAPALVFVSPGNNPVGGVGENGWLKKNFVGGGGNRWVG